MYVMMYTDVYMPNFIGGLLVSKSAKLLAKLLASCK